MEFFWGQPFASVQSVGDIIIAQRLTKGFANRHPAFAWLVVWLIACKFLADSHA
jgi:hypothetical protein